MDLFRDKQRMHELLKNRVKTKWHCLKTKHAMHLSKNVSDPSGGVFKNYSIRRVVNRKKWHRSSFRQVVHYSDISYIETVFKRYEISRCGKYVRHIRNRDTMLSIEGKGKYARVGLYDDDGKQRLLRVHRLVASTFLGRPSKPGLTVDHKHRNKKDNSAKNLRWATRKQQILNRGTFSQTAQKIALIGYHTETNETRTFASAHDAAKELGKGFHQQNISRAVKNSTTYKGWTFTKDSLPEIPGQEFREWFLRDGRPSNIFFGNCGYMIDVGGTVREIKSFSSDPDEYPYMNIGGKNRYIHILVAILFHGESPGPDYIVHHKDNVKNNACASNLVWITKSRNMELAHADGCYDDSTHKRRKCSIDGIEYASIAAAAVATKMNRHTLKYRLNSTSPKFAAYIFIE